MDKTIQTNKNKKIHYAWIILISMCIIRSLSAAGINNIGGLFLTPVSTELGIGVGTLSIYFSVSSIAILLFMPIAGKLIKKFSIKRLVIVASILQTAGFIALGFMKSVWGWYIMSIPMGIGGAILVNLAGPILINRWFKNNTGTVLGIMMACVGLFGAAIQPLTLIMISGIGWRKTYILLGSAIAVIILLVSTLLLKSSPAEKGLKPLEKKTEDKQPTNASATKNVSLKSALKSPAFYFLLVFMIAITAFGAFSQHMATYGESLGYSSSKMGTILSISMIGSTVGAIFIGAISDKLGLFKTIVVILGGVIASIVCLAFGKASYIIFAAGSFLLGLSAMGIPILAPLLTSEFFGTKDYASIYSNVMMGPPFASVVLLPLYGFLFDLKGNYSLVLVIMCVFAVIGAVCILMGWKSKDKLSA